MSIPFAGTEEDLARIESLAAMGYQYVEPAAGSLSVEGDPERFYAVRRALRRAALTPEVFSDLLPEGLNPMGDDVDWARIEGCLEGTIRRAVEVGARVVTVDTETWRAPQGYPRDEALAQVRYLVNMAAGYAEDVVVAVAPLRAAGILVGVAEMTELLRELGRPELRLLVDSFRFGASWEPWEALVRAGDVLGHVHWRKRDRLVLGAGEADLAGFSGALTDSAYDGRVTIRLPRENLEDEAEEALAKVRELVAGKRE